MSLASIPSACSSKAASSGSVVLPTTSMTGMASSRVADWARAASSELPTQMTVPPESACVRRSNSAKWPGGQRFVSQREPALSVR